MIQNEQDYQIAKQRLDELSQSLGKRQDSASSEVAKADAKGEIEAIDSEINRLQGQIILYEHSHGKATILASMLRESP